MERLERVTDGHRVPAKALGKRHFASPALATLACGVWTCLLPSAFPGHPEKQVASSRDVAGLDRNMKHVCKIIASQLCFLHFHAFNDVYCIWLAVASRGQWEPHPHVSLRTAARCRSFCGCGNQLVGFAISLSRRWSPWQAIQMQYDAVKPC